MLDGTNVVSIPPTPRTKTRREFGLNCNLPTLHQSAFTSVLEGKVVMTSFEKGTKRGMLYVMLRWDEGERCDNLTHASHLRDQKIAKSRLKRVKKA